MFELTDRVPAQVHDRGDLAILEAVVRERDALALVWIELAEGVADPLAIFERVEVEGGPGTGRVEWAELSGRDPVGADVGDQRVVGDLKQPGLEATVMDVGVPVEPRLRERVGGEILSGVVIGEPLVEVGADQVPVLRVDCWEIGS